jgi:cell division protein DivIC
MKKRKRRFFWLIVIAFFATIFIRQQIIINRLSKEYEKSLDQLQKLQFQHAQLNEQLKQSKRADYIEKLAREKLRLVKPGEILFIDRNKAQ